MSQLHVLPMLAARFTVVAKNKAMIAEASDFGYNVCRAPYERLYDDACDVGIAIQGHRGTARFFLADTDEDGEGDIAGWRFEPTPETLRAFPGLAGWHVTIIND